MITKKTSKELLADSFSELLKSKPFDKITVNEIASNCNLAKRTFYYYFNDKYDLALWLYIHQLDQYCDQNRETVTFYRFLRHSAEVIWKDRFLIQNLIRYSGQNNFRQSVYTPLVDRYLHIIQHNYGDQITPDIQEAVHFFVGGMIAYVEHDLNKRAETPPEQAVALFTACIPRTLEKYLKNP